jgi:hypothetical protein
MSAFKNYLFSAAGFSVVATAVCLLTGLSAKLMEFYVFSFIPIMLGLFLSGGNVHALSEIGLYLGMVVNWLLVGLLISVALWFVKRAKNGKQPNM